MFLNIKWYHNRYNIYDSKNVKNDVQMFILIILLQNVAKCCKIFQNFYIQNMPSSQYILKSNGFMGILIRNITYMIYFILK